MSENVKKMATRKWTIDTTLYGIVTFMKSSQEVQQIGLPLQLKCYLDVSYHNLQRRRDSKTTRSNPINFIIRVICLFFIYRQINKPSISAHCKIEPSINFYLFHKHSEVSCIKNDHVKYETDFKTILINDMLRLNPK